MILSQRNIRRAGLAAFALPIVIAALVRVIAPAALPGPASAKADEDPESRAGAFTLNAPTEAQLVAARRILEIEESAVVPNRLAYAESTIQRQTATTEPMTDNTPEFVVTSIVDGRIGRVALINGKLRREGDVAAPNWTVILIDESAREVTLAGPDDETLVVKLRRPDGR